MSNPSTATRRRVLAGAGATVALAGCTGLTGDDETETPTPTPAAESTDTPAPTETPTARVRVSHMSPNAPNVDVYVDGDAVLEDVPFGATSGYLEVPVGEREVEITPAGDPDTAVFSGGVPVEADTDYTVAAVGEIGDDADEEFKPLVLEDDNSDPGDGSARVQVVHASPDAPAVDVTVAASGDAIFDGVSFGDSGAVEVPAGDYTLEIRGDTDGNDGDVVAAFDVSLEGGEVYTAFASGYLTPDDEPADTPFDLRFARGDVASQVRLEPRVRVAHMSPNAPNVDVYVDGNIVLEDVPFGATSDYLGLAAGTYTVEITPAGDSHTTVFEGEVPVEARTDYTIAAIGEVGHDADKEFEPLILVDDNSDPGEDTARVRTVHASPDAPAVDVTVAASGDAIVDGAAYGQAATAEVPAGEYTLQIRGDTAGNDGDVVAEFDVKLEGGTVYTAFAAGYLTPDDEPADAPFELLVTKDAEA